MNPKPKYRNPLTPKQMEILFALTVGSLIAGLSVALIYVCSNL